MAERNALVANGPNLEELQAADYLKQALPLFSLHLYGDGDTTKDSSGTSYIACGEGVVDRDSFPGGESSIIATFRFLAKVDNGSNPCDVKIVKDPYGTPSDLGNLNISDTSFTWYAINVSTGFPVSGVVSLQVQMRELTDTFKVTIKKALLEIKRN